LKGGAAPSANATISRHGHVDHLQIGPRGPCLSPSFTLSQSCPSRTVLLRGLYETSTHLFLLVHRTRTRPGGDYNEPRLVDIPGQTSTANDTAPRSRPTPTTSAECLPRWRGLARRYASGVGTIRRFIAHRDLLNTARITHENRLSYFRCRDDYSSAAPRRACGDRAARHRSGSRGPRPGNGRRAWISASRCAGRSCHDLRAIYSRTCVVILPLFLLIPSPSFSFFSTVLLRVVVRDGIRHFAATAIASGHSGRHGGCAAARPASSPAIATEYPSRRACGADTARPGAAPSALTSTLC